MDVQLAAPARDGEANSELLRFLAEVLGLRKTALSLDKVWVSLRRIISHASQCSFATVPPKHC